MRKQRDRGGKKIRRLEDEKIKEQDDWMNRMISAGLDGTNKRDEWTDPFGGMNRMAGWKKTGIKDLSFHSTWDIIEAAEKGLLPDKIMLNTHPQRWDDRFGPWVRPSETLLRRMLSACFTG